MLDKFSINIKDSIKILVIDDMSYMRAIIVDMLERLGLTDITQASDGEGGLALINSHQFSMVLCDWHMPKLNGVSLLRIIRLSHSTKTLPFIMVTSNQKVCDVRDCIDSGVSGFLLKPFDLASLEKQISDIYDDVLLHHRTLGILTDEIIKELEAQSKPAS
jgi:two-component system chemotaxis response regulator CheY